MTRVSVGGRLHFGFQNLSLAHGRLYGGVGVAVDEPRLTLRAERADGVTCDDDGARPYVERVVDHLGLPGASVTPSARSARSVSRGSSTATPTPP